MKKINKEMIKEEYSSKYIKVYDMQYEENFHYYNASRRNKDELIALKNDIQQKNMLADGVCCFIIYQNDNQEKLLLQKEFRYPINQEMTAIPAGMIDRNEDIITAAKREIFEETGLKVKNAFVVNPLVYSSPGLTDESCALVCAVVENITGLCNNNTEDTEIISDYMFIDKKQAREMIERGRDSADNYYPLFTFAALMYFISDLWKNIKE